MDGLENKIHRKESNETFAILLNIAIRNVMEDFLSCDVKKKNGEEFFYYFRRFTIVFCARAFLRYPKHGLERRHASWWRIFLSLLYFPSSNITAKISFNFNESLKFVKRMNSNYIYGVFNSSKKEACFKGRR